MSKQETPVQNRDPFTFHLFAVNLLEKLVEILRGLMSANLLDFCTKWLSRIGHLGIIVAAGLAFLFALVFSIRTNTFTGFLYGIGFVLVIFVVQYTAHKFADAGEKLIKNNPTRMASRTFLDCLAFLLVIGGVVVLILSIVQAIQFKSFMPFLGGLGIFVFMEFLAMVSFNPAGVTIEIVENNSAGQEAIGIITFFMKAIMKLIPIFFGVGIVLGIVRLFINFIRLFGSNYGAGLEGGIEAGSVILVAGLLPFLGYLAFILYYLVVDIIRAILSIPEQKGI